MRGSHVAVFFFLSTEAEYPCGFSFTCCVGAEGSKAEGSASAEVAKDGRMWMLVAIDTRSLSRKDALLCA